MLGPRNSGYAQAVTVPKTDSGCQTLMSFDCKYDIVNETICSPDMNKLYYNLNVQKKSAPDDSMVNDINNLYAKAASSDPRAAKGAALAASLIASTAAPTVTTAAATDAATSVTMETEDANDADYMEADHRRPKPNARRHSTDDEESEATPRTAPPTPGRDLPLGNEFVVPPNIDLFIRNANAPHKEDSNKTGRNPAKLNKKEKQPSS